MSRVYEYYLKMEELFQDADYQEWLCEQQMKDEDLEAMAKEKYDGVPFRNKDWLEKETGKDLGSFPDIDMDESNGEEAKAEKFVKKMLEE